MPVVLKNPECPYCGSHKNVNGAIATCAIGGVLCIFGIVFRPLSLIGLIILVAGIVQASTSKSRYCSDCHKTWTIKTEEPVENETKE